MYKYTSSPMEWTPVIDMFKKVQICPSSNERFLHSVLWPVFLCRWFEVTEVASDHWFTSKPQNKISCCVQQEKPVELSDLPEIVLMVLMVNHVQDEKDPQTVKMIKLANMRRPLHSTGKNGHFVIFVACRMLIELHQKHRSIMITT